MPLIRFYFDFVSPYAYVAFHALPQALAGLGHQVEYRPLVLGALLKAHGTPPPVGLPSKRDWIVRHCAWLAAQQHLQFAVPQPHPFNTIPWLRMALAASPQGRPGRYVVQYLFDALWHPGVQPDDAAQQQRVWQEMTALQPEVRDPGSEAVKQELFALGEEALRLGVFGVPSCVLMPEQDNQAPQLFWGMEGLPMLREAVAARQTIPPGPVAQAAQASQGQQEAAP